MTEALLWDELTRVGQRVFINLLGGGSLKHEKLEVVGRSIPDPEPLGNR